MRRTVLLVQTPRYDRVPVLLRYEPFSHALVFLLDPTPAMAHGFEAWCKAHGVPCDAGRRPTVSEQTMQLPPHASEVPRR